MAQETEYASRLARHRAGPEAATQVTLGTQVYGVLREFLIEGAFQPGEKLSLRSLAEALEVSVQPVRDAVARLIRDGALEVAPNRAVRVPLMTAPQFIELTAIRLAIEGFAVETAARAHSATDLQKIRRFDRAFRRQCKAARPDPERAVQANQGLHFSIYHAARMPALMPIIEGLWLRIGPVLNLDMRDSPQRLRIGGAEACHGALVAGLEARCGATARAALEDDIRTAAASIRGRGVFSGGAAWTCGLQ